MPIAWRRAGVVSASLIVAGLAAPMSWALSAAPGAERTPAQCSTKTPTQTAPEQRPAARGRLAPLGATSIRLCRYSGLNAHPELTLIDQRFLADESVLRKLTREFNHLPKPPRGVVACPADDGSEIVALLGYSNDREVMISLHLTGCTQVTNGSVSRVGTQRLIARLKHLVG